LWCGLTNQGFSAAPTFRLDHFKIYKIQIRPEQQISAEIRLKGQFDVRPREANIKGPALIANPVSKNDGRILDGNAHLTVYFITRPVPEPERTVTVRNQFFGTRERELKIGNPEYLLVPTSKTHDRRTYPKSRRLDHFKCYKVLEGDKPEADVRLVDQFERTENVALKPVLFGVPVAKEHDGVVTRIINPRDHLVIYELKRHDSRPVARIGLTDQFGQFDGEVYTRMYLCVPSQKLDAREIRRTRPAAPERKPEK
jgi:hypothetical protein